MIPMMRKSEVLQIGSVEKEYEEGQKVVLVKEAMRKGQCHLFNGKFCLVGEWLNKIHFNRTRLD